MNESKDLRFVGKMVASISHELKNSIAVVNENAGFIQDLLAMAEQGRPLSPERLQVASRRIQNQIGRANEIIRRLNQFAHSVDDPALRMDPALYTRLTVDLYHRLADQKGVKLEFEPGGLEAALTGSPFNLIRLVAGILEWCLAGVDHDKTIRLGLAKTGAKTALRFSGLRPDAGDIHEFSPDIAELADGLGVKITRDDLSGDLLAIF